MGVFFEMKTKEKKSEHISMSGLKGKRGWTDTLIKHFLPTPDKTAINQHYRTGPPMKLYLLSNVNTIEQSDEFKAMMANAPVKKSSAKKAVHTKQNKIMKYVNAITVEVPIMSKGELIRNACNSYNNRKANYSYNGDDFDYHEPANKDSDWTFLNRICINYLRHRCTKYEEELEKIFGKVGVNQAYTSLKAKVNNAILKAYNFLEPVNTF